MANTPDKVPVKVIVKLRLPRTSRFLSSKFYPDLENGYSRWPFNIHTIAPAVDDAYYVVAAGEEKNWQLLSYRLYGSTFLWWVLALVNGSRDAFDGRPRVREMIRVPQASRVLGIQQGI